MEPDPLSGKTLGAYRITEKIGQGGMGAVYLATHHKLGREAAVKILPRRLVDKNPQFAQRFFVEARTAAQINHPNIVQIHDAGEHEGLHYIAMEYVRGVTLKEYLEKKVFLTEEEAIRVVVQAAKGLGEAAKRAVIHRDIKPANVMIADSGSVKIMDFGLAKDLESDVSVTVSGQVLGTPAYMSPEQGEAEPVDFRTDVYSLGVTLFEMLTGHKPYQGETAVSILMKHCTAPIPDPRTIRPGLNPELVSVVMRMMAKKPADRYGSYAELLRALSKVRKAIAHAERTADEPPPAPPPAPRRGEDFDTPPTLPDAKISKRKRPRDRTPTHARARKERTARPEPPPKKGSTGLIAGVVGGVVLLIAIVAAVAVSMNDGRGGRPAPEPEPPKDAPVKPPPDKPKSRVDRAKALQKEGKLRDALDLLASISRGHPEYEEAAPLLASIRTTLEDRERTKQEEEAYAVFWAAAQDTRTRAEISDEPELWEAVADAAENARTARDTEEARALATLARARLDLALARLAEGDEDFEEAVRLAKRAATHGVALEGLAAYTRTLIAKWDDQLARGQDARFDALAKKARDEEAKGADGDPEKALGLWREALECAEEETQQALAKKRIEVLTLELRYVNAMARGRTAENGGEREAALKAYREALEAKPGDPAATDALARAGKAAAPPPDTPAERKERYRALVREAGRKAREEGEDALVESLKLWREALALADDPLDRRLVERSMRPIVTKIIQDGMRRGREAETKGDWITASWGYGRAVFARPEEKFCRASLERVQARLAAVAKALGDRFVIPGGDVRADAHGRPVTQRDGFRMDTRVGLPLEIWLVKPPMEFVLAPAGEFDLGSPETESGRFVEEGPQARIAFAASFYVGKYEVTQAQWEAVMGSNPSVFKGADRPVECVAWKDAKAFFEKLNAGAPGADKAPLRLPSEAEWEYAARAGTKTRYFFGDDRALLGQFAWYIDNAKDGTRPVGGLKPNPWGLYDVIGNVWEWCEDVKHDSYDGVPRDGSPWVEGGADGIRRIRGGAFNVDERNSRMASRVSDPQDKRVSSLGFRAAFTPASR